MPASRLHVDRAREARNAGLAAIGFAADEVDAVDGDAPAALQLGRSRNQAVASRNAGLKGDMRVDADRHRPVRVRSQAERGVGEGEDGAAMAAAIEVDVP